jgi:hypothetical protein
VDLQSARGQASLLLGGAAIGFSALALRPPVAGAYPACPWLTITGMDCPFCGGLRSATAMLHGDWATAVDYNLLAAVMVPLVLVGAVLALLLGARAQPMVQSFTSGRALTLALVVVAGWFVLRMLPFAGWLPSTA